MTLRLCIDIRVTYGIINVPGGSAAERAGGGIADTWCSAPWLRAREGSSPSFGTNKSRRAEPADAYV